MIVVHPNMGARLAVGTVEASWARPDILCTTVAGGETCLVTKSIYC